MYSALLLRTSGHRLLINITHNRKLNVIYRVSEQLFRKSVVCPRSVPTRYSPYSQCNMVKVFDYQHFSKRGNQLLVITLDYTKKQIEGEQMR